MFCKRCGLIHLRAIDVSLPLVFAFAVMFDYGLVQIGVYNLMFQFLTALFAVVGTSSRSKTRGIH